MSSAKMPTPSDFPPVLPRVSKFFIFENREFYDVAAMQRDIAANPNAFEFGTIATEKLRPQLEEKGFINQTYLDSVSDEHARRPLIFITYSNRSKRLVDGYHRGLKALQVDIPLVAAYILTHEQTQSYILTGTQLAKLLNGRMI